MIHDGVASPALTASEADFPSDARTRAPVAYEAVGAARWKADELVAAALGACGGDAELRTLVLDNLDSLLVDGANSLRTAEKVRERVEKLAGNFAELRQLAANDPELFAQGLDLLRVLHGKALPAGLFGRLVQTAWEQPVNALKGLTARSRGLALHQAVVQFVDNIERAGRESGVNDMGAGPEEAAACREFLLRRMFAGFSRADLEGLHAALHSPNGARLLAAYADAQQLVAGRDLSEGVRNTVGSTASVLRLQFFELNAILCRHLGIAEEVPVPFNGPVPRLAAFGAAGLDDDLVRLARERNAAAAKAVVASYVHGNGPAAERLRGVFENRLGPEPASPESTLRDDIQSVARSMLTRSVVNDMKNFATGQPTQFDRDRDREFKTTLVGVGEVSTDPAVARDQFAKFVTKNPAATYASLDARSRNQAHLAMAEFNGGDEKGFQEKRVEKMYAKLPEPYRIDAQCKTNYEVELRG